LPKIVGTVIGGVWHILLTQFVSYPYVALGYAGYWLGLNAALSAMFVRPILVLCVCNGAVTAVNYGVLGYGKSLYSQQPKSVIS